MKKTILVIGATPGFGKDIAFELSRLGHQVIATLQRNQKSKILSAKQRSKIFF